MEQRDPRGIFDQEPLELLVLLEPLRAAQILRLTVPR